MKKIGFILLMLAFLVYFPSAGQTQEVGDNAPDFSLVSVSGEEFRLNGCKGRKNIVLIFYADNT